MKPTTKQIEEICARVERAYPRLPQHIVYMTVQAFHFPGSASGFYKAVIDNDLAEAVCRADNEHARHLYDIAILIHRDFSILQVTGDAHV